MSPPSASSHMCDTLDRGQWGGHSRGRGGERAAQSLRFFFFFFFYTGAAYPLSSNISPILVSSVPQAAALAAELALVEPYARHWRRATQQRRRARLEAALLTPLPWKRTTALPCIKPSPPPADFPSSFPGPSRITHSLEAQPPAAASVRQQPNSRSVTTAFGDSQRSPAGAISPILVDDARSAATKEAFSSSTERRKEACGRSGAGPQEACGRPGAGPQEVCGRPRAGPQEVCGRPGAGPQAPSSSLAAPSQTPALLKTLGQAPFQHPARSAFGCVSPPSAAADGRDREWLTGRYHVAHATGRPEAAGATGRPEAAGTTGRPEAAGAHRFDVSFCTARDQGLGLSVKGAGPVGASTNELAEGSGNNSSVGARPQHRPSPRRPSFI